MSLVTELYYEPWDPACRDRAFELYQELLEHAPVYETGTRWASLRWVSVSVISRRMWSSSSE